MEDFSMFLEAIWILVLVVILAKISEKEGR